MIRFLPARQIRRTIGAAAAAVIADEYTETYPCPLARVAPYVLRVVFYRETGRPPQRTVELPRYVAEVDGVSGKILRVARCTPDEVGVVSPLAPVAGAGLDPTMPVDEIFRRRDRLLDLAPAVWEAFVSTVGIAGAASATEVIEFHDLLLSLTRAEVAPFYRGSVPDFFRWLRATAGKP